MASIISTSDLPAAIQSHELAGLMVDAANAKASRVAPCLTWTGAADSDTPTPSDDQLAEARLVLVGMVKRWVDAGSGALQATVAGPFQATVDTRQRGGFNPWPSEIKALQDICATSTSSASAFSIRPTCSGSGHMPWCATMLGAAYCSCGYDLTNGEFPLYEGGLLTEECL